MHRMCRDTLGTIDNCLLCVCNDLFLVCIRGVLCPARRRPPAFAAFFACRWTNSKKTAGADNFQTVLELTC